VNAKIIIATVNIMIQECVIKNAVKIVEVRVNAIYSLESALVAMKICGG